MSLQPLYQKMRGIIGNLFGFQDGEGAQIKSISSEILEIRDKNDTNYGILRGKNPVGSQDYAPKNWVEGLVVGGSGALRTMMLPFSFNGANISTNSIPSGLFVFGTMLEITQVFDNAQTQIMVGRSNATSLIMAESDNTPTSLGVYLSWQATNWQTGDANVVVTIVNPNSGYQTGLAVNKLIDSTALFQTNLVQIGDTVTNNTTLATATVANVDSEIQLSLSSDIFPNYSLKISGSNTSAVSSKLVDTGSDFVAAGIIAGDRVLNTSDNLLANVISVDSPTQLSISCDIFLTFPKNYDIFSSERYAVNDWTQGQGNCVVFYSSPDN